MADAGCTRWTSLISEVVLDGGSNGSPSSLSSEAVSAGVLTGSFSYEESLTDQVVII